MKTADFKKSFSAARRAVKETVHRITLAHMVADNIADLIPPEWQITVNSYGIRVAPKEGVTITPDVFDKFMAKFAKAVHKEPSKTIGTEEIDFTYYLYPAFGESTWDSIMVEFKLGNTEKCDVEEVEQLTKSYKLTGYCKALYEKKYVQAN